MKANSLQKRCALLSLIATVAIAPASTVLARSGPVAPVAGTAPAKAIVVDNAQVAPLELLLFVHRADLPLRPLPNK